MENKFEITKEIMGKAQTYIPIAMKEMLASDIAYACIKPTYKIHPHGEEDQFSGEYGLKPVYCESPSMKARFLMSVLLNFYLKVRGDDQSLLCEVDEYDGWAGAHVLNQIERFKAGEYREKAFDILSDYRETERYINSAIYAVLRDLNDPAKRIMDALSTMTDSDALQQAIEGMHEAEKAIADENKRQERIINGEEGEENAGE